MDVRSLLWTAVVLCLAYHEASSQSSLDGKEEEDSGKPVVFTSTKYSSHSSVSYSKGGTSGSPTFEFLSPKGLKVNIPKVEPLGSPHQVTALLNLNKEIEGDTAGWKGEKVIHSGMDWSFTLPEAKVTEGDRLYFWVTVRKPGDETATEGEYKGSYQVSDSNPHSRLSSSSQGLDSGTFLSQSQTPKINFSSWNDKDPDDLFSKFPSISGGDTDFSNIFSQFGCSTCHSASDFLDYTKKDNKEPAQIAQALPAQASQTQAQRPVFKEEIRDNAPPTTPKPAKPEEECRKSPSFLNGKSMCAGEIHKVSTFSYDQHLGSNPESSFTVFSQDNVKDGGANGMVSCHPTTLEATYGPSAVNNNLNLGICTAVNSELCHYSPASYLITPPVVGCRISSKTRVSFLYGTLAVKAKLPAGDWIVSEITLEPAAWVYGHRSGRIVVARSRGNSELKTGEGVDYSSRVLEAGIELWDGPYTFRKILDRPWSDEEHEFKLIWTPDKLQFLVDNEEIGQIQPSNEGLDKFIRGTNLAPFDKEFYLQFGLHIGGNRDFPDGLKGKPWKNYEPKDKLKFWQGQGKWLPTWSEDKSSLKILSSKITSLQE